MVLAAVLLYFLVVVLYVVNIVIIQILGKCRMENYIQ